MRKDSFYLNHLKEGLLTNNPTFVQLLGMCPTLAVTTSISNSIGMGLSATAVLMFSNLFISFLRKLIPPQVRIAAYVVIISGFVTAIELLLHAFLPSLYASLGLFIPLIVVNCIILARAEAFASKNTPIRSLWDGLCMGLGFTFALMLIGTVRELVGSGSILGFDLTFGIWEPALLFIMPAGAFLTLGCIIAAVNAIRDRAEKKGKEKTTAPAGEPIKEEV